MNFSRLDYLIAAAAALVMTSAAICAAQVEAAAADAPTVSWARGPGDLVVSYREVWPEIADQDPTPLIRIFGDGRVLVHHGAYSPRAGEYDLRLPAAELEDLLASLAAMGLADFDGQATKRLRVTEERRRWDGALAADSPPELFMVADDATSVFELHLTGYRPAGATLTSGAVDRTVAWRGLGTDAGRFPEIAAIQGLRAAELELRSLLERPELRRTSR